MVMGDKTDTFLFVACSESYKRELDADESIWRTLPFFVALVGLAITVLPPTYRAAIALRLLWWRIPALGFLTLAVVAFGVAIVLFWRVIKLRDYRYPPVDTKIVDYARQLDEFYGAKRLSAAARDEATRDDLRKFLTDEFAAAVAQNRKNNTDKIAARSLVLLAAVFRLPLGVRVRSDYLGGRSVRMTEVERSKLMATQHRSATGAKRQSVKGKLKPKPPQHEVVRDGASVGRLLHFIRSGTLSQ